MPESFTDLRSNINLLRKYLTQRAYANRLIAFCEAEGILDCSRKAARFTAEEMNARLGSELGFKTGNGRERMVGILLDLLSECGILEAQKQDGRVVYAFKGASRIDTTLDTADSALMEEIFSSKMEFFDRCVEHAGVFLRGGDYLYEFDDGAATIWDRFLGNFEFKVAREFLVSAMNTHTTRQPKILDLCCGTGHGLDAILKEWPDARVTALDFTGAMRKTALAKVAKYNGAINWIDPLAWAGFGHPLPFTDHAFDKVFFSCGDPYISAPLRYGVYSEIKRVLKPGGVLGSVAWGYPDIARTHVNDPWIRIGVYIHDFAESVCRGWQGFHDIDATVRMAEELGFERCNPFFNSYYMLDTAAWLFKTPDGKKPDAGRTQRP